MNVWLSLPFLPPEGLRELTLAAEQAGVSGVALSDHPCVPIAFNSDYPYNQGKPVQLPPETELPDPLVAIAGLSGIATSVRFMTAVLILPLRHPVLLAKEVATVAAISGNRVDLGVGVGWLREEFEALGLDYFDERGSVADEMLPLLRALWTGSPVAHAGHHFSFEEVAVRPAPTSPVPIFIGGHSNAALARCAAFGDGWVGATPSVDELPHILGRLAEARAKAGTDDRPFEVRTGIRGTLTPQRIAIVRDMGVTSLLVAPWQVGERRDSVFDLPVAAIADALPAVVESVLAG